MAIYISGLMRKIKNSWRAYITLGHERCISTFETLFFRENASLWGGSCLGVERWVRCVFWLSDTSQTDLETSVCTLSLTPHSILLVIFMFGVLPGQWAPSIPLSSTPSKLSLAVISSPVLCQAMCIYPLSDFQNSLKLLV